MRVGWGVREREASRLVLVYCLCAVVTALLISLTPLVTGPAYAQAAGVGVAVSRPVEAGPPRYVGNDVCTACHVEQIKSFGETIMGKLFTVHPREDRQRLGCEGCHGPGSIYSKEMAKAMKEGRKPGQAYPGPARAGVITFRKDSGESAQLDNEICLQCHEKGERAFWRASTHAFREVRCVDCHTIMRKVSPRFQLAQALDSNPWIITRPETQVCFKCHLRRRVQENFPSHMPMREGLIVCTDCHNPHGGPYPHQLKYATVNQVCYVCHAEKRGPFLRAHPPVIQDCTICHDPHGSINRFLLKFRPPRLCQNCHAATGHPATPRPPNTVYVFSRACLNCHSAIHGSNSPGGTFLTR
jgi:DmsE family decaheme c-type cytochrome